MLAYNSQDLISVIIPAYNHEKYIGETIESVIEQSYRHIELIIVNDGSIDNTRNVVKSYLAKCDSRFVRTEYIEKENEGTAKTLNKGLALAKGKYVALIASDDKYAPNAIETLHGFLSKNEDYGFVTSNNYFIDENSTRCYWDKKRNNIYDKTKAEYSTAKQFFKRPYLNLSSESFGSYTSLLEGCYIPNGYLIKKEVLDLVGNYNENAQIEDLNLFLQLSKVTKMKYIDLPLFYYRWHNHNYSKNTKKFLRAYRQTLMLEKDYASKHGFKKEFDSLVQGNIRNKKFLIFSKTKHNKLCSSKKILRIFNIPVYIKIKTLQKERKMYFPFAKSCFLNFANMKVSRNATNQN